MSELFPDLSSPLDAAVYLLTIVLQGALFLFSVYILNRLVFSKVLQILNLRKKETFDLEAQALEFKTKALVLREEFDWRVDGTHQLAEDKIKILELMGKRRADMILSEVRKGTNQDLENIVKRTEDAYWAVRPVMEKKIKGFSDDIVDKLTKVD